MLNVSALSRETRLGRAARWPLRFMPREMAIPILQGPARGLRWVVGASNHGCWLGSFEADLQRALFHAIPKGGVFYDVGANAGFYSLLATRRAARIVAFEPDTRARALLLRHIALNHLGDQVAVEPVAVNHRVGDFPFDERENAAISSLAGVKGSLLREAPDPIATHLVHTTTLDVAAFGGGHAPPDIVKIDVEGAEALVLQGASRLLAERRPTFFIELHGPADDDVRAILRDAGYTLDYVGGWNAPGQNANTLCARPS